LSGWEDDQTGSFRGSKSRNKVSVGEPAEGSLTKRGVARPVGEIHDWVVCSYTTFILYAYSSRVKVKIRT
jgi:hypothetical protein